MRLEPNSGAGYEFVNQIKGGVIPGEFISSVNKGVVKTMEKGILAGFPVVDVKVVLTDGSHHAVDSSDMAFQICSSICFKNGFMKANPILLEPVMKIEVNTPDDYIGNVVGDLNKRRGKIESMRRYRAGSQKLNGFVPLMEMFGYANTLRNISSGRANYSMEFYQYMPIPAATQEEVLKKLEEKKQDK
jgi:elongation factor G